MRSFIALFLVYLCTGGLCAKPVKDFDASLAFTPFVKAGGIAPVVVEFETNSDVKGVLELSAGRNLVKRQINVGKGKFHYEMPVPVTSDVKGVSVRLHGKGVDEKKSIGISMCAPDRYLFGWVGLGLQPDPMVSKSGWNVMFSRVSPVKLPSDWRMYDGLDALLLGRYPAKLSTAQADAIAQWCRMGGRVIAGPNAPLELYATAELSKRMPWPPANPEGGSLFNTAPFGLGVIGTSSIRLTRLQMENVFDNKHLDLHGAGIVEANWFLDRTQSGWSKLDGDCSVPRISLSAIVVYVLILFVLVCLVEPYVLKRIRRMHWTWVITPLLVVLFCYGADYISFLVRGVHSKQATMVFSDFGLNGKCRRTVAIAFTPSTSGRYRFTPPSESTLNLDGNITYAWDMDDGCTFSSPVWKTHHITIVTPSGQTPPFSSDLRRDGSVLRGEVTSSGVKVVGKIQVVYRYCCHTRSGGCWKEVGRDLESACSFGLGESRRPLFGDDYAWIVARVADGETTRIDCLRKEKHYYYVRQLVRVRSGGAE